MSRPFWWFHGASVAQLRAALESAADPRLEVHLDGVDMTFLVRDAAISTESHEDDHINDSHLCPPDCP